jgi:glycosyltransferase involved in cell wall biosynthesis
MNITALVLTYNEEIHIERCLRSILPLTQQIVVVDSLSTDNTVKLARSLGAQVLERAWENNHSTQVNWALDQLPSTTDWIMRIDADEILTPQLVKQIQVLLPSLKDEVKGISCIRKMVFQGKLIRYGGVGRNIVLRLFRFKFGRSESRWMDEHIKLSGSTTHLSGALIDDNLRPLSWWQEKHRNYAKREAVDLLNLEYQFLQKDRKSDESLTNSPIGLKRQIKEGLYAKLPGGIRAAAYFAFRYFVLLGFLDGKQGSQFHYWQAFWYRNLADQNVASVKKYMRENGLSAKEAIRIVLGISV